jgi:hypothetical protein
MARFVEVTQTTGHRHLINTDHIQMLSLSAEKLFLVNFLGNSTFMKIESESFADLYQTLKGGGGKNE